MAHALYGRLVRIALGLALDVVLICAFAAIAADKRVQQALAFIKADDGNTLADQKTITVIAAPPFKEKIPTFRR